jgi:hypothetical protein
LPNRHTVFTKDMTPLVPRLVDGQFQGLLNETRQL